MTPTHYKLYSHSTYKERSPTSEENGWVLIDEFDYLENAENHMKLLINRKAQWHVAKSYRIEQTTLVGNQVNVTRVSALKAYADPMKRI